uniref:Uncharacterized protein n=1 Tax=Timema cristinae TaxID=61476 RepID=A0A7R9DSJ7_TIMCR|nr:unnamed protein product [Timema cristinae]
MTDNFFDWTFPGVGRNIFFFYVNGIVFASILMFIEFRCFEKILYRTKLIGARLSNGDPRTSVLEHLQLPHLRVRQVSPRTFEELPEQLLVQVLVQAHISLVRLLEEVEDEDSDVAAERKLIRMNERRTLRMNYKLLLM